jgi:hypothetical protein
MARHSTFGDLAYLESVCVRVCARVYVGVWAMKGKRHLEFDRAKRVAHVERKRKRRGGKRIWRSAAGGDERKDKRGSGEAEEFSVARNQNGVTLQYLPPSLSRSRSLLIGSIHNKLGARNNSPVPVANIANIVHKFACTKICLATRFPRGHLCGS